MNTTAQAPAPAAGELSPMLDALLEVLAAKVAAHLRQQPATDPHKRYTAEELAAMYGLSKDAIYKRIRAGEFGETINIGKRTHRVTEEGIRYYDAHHTGPAANGTEPRRPERRRRRAPDPGWI